MNDQINSKQFWLIRLRIKGFRSYGTEVQEINTDSPLTLISAENSQGKTATAEAIEFLISGQSSRRDLFGGAKSEYDRMLTNVHLASAPEVWVEADVRLADSRELTVRRTLITDYEQSRDCDSTFTVDGKDVDGSEWFRLLLSPPPLQAPVLLQHNLRYALSTEPQKRADYFSAVLSLDDLKIITGALGEAKKRLEGFQTPELLSLLQGGANSSTSAAPHLAAALKAKNELDLGISIDRAVMAFLGAEPEASADAVALIRAEVAKAEEQLFPIRSFLVSLELVPEVLSVDSYLTRMKEYELRLAEVEPDSAALAVLFEAVVQHDRYGALPEGELCPVCEDGTLSPERVEQIRASLAAQSELNRSVEELLAELGDVDRKILSFRSQWMSLTPDCLNWDDARWKIVSAELNGLLTSASPNIDVVERAGGIRGQIAAFGEVWESLVGICEDTAREVKEVLAQVAARKPSRVSLADSSLRLARVSNQLKAIAAGINETLEDISTELGDKLRKAELKPGTRELLQLVEGKQLLFAQIRSEAKRSEAKKRLAKVTRVVSAAEKALIDQRFEQMGSEIDRWWRSLRPNELIGFGGVTRRASGRRYVDLGATLAHSEETTPEERAAIGVFSDSQLNALGLSAFLARQSLSKIPLVVLDDPLPGFDPDHTETFADHTLRQLLSSGSQVILLTHNPKLSVSVRELHSYMGIQHYRLTLSNAIEGTEALDEGDIFGEYMTTAQDLIRNRTLGGRKDAAVALRCAAERLAKQIIATNRTDAGEATRVSEVGEKTLGELEPDVRLYVLTPDEAGRWKRWKRLLNPGAHDNDVPSTTDLGVVFGDLRKLKRKHEQKWAGGLLK